MRRASMIVLVAMMVMATRGQSAAATYYVDTTGSDDSDGSARAPLLSIQAAANRVVAGDVVIVRQGIYQNPDPGFLIQLDRGGTEAAWVTFRSEIPGGAIIDGNDNRSSHCWVLLGGASYVRIEGFEVRGCADAGFHSNAGAQHVMFVGNHIHDIGRLCTDTISGKVAFYQGSGSGYHTYDGNLIHDIGRFGPGEHGCNPTNHNYQNHDHGLYLNSSHALVINNVFHHLEHGWPIHIYGSHPKDDIAIVNNTFAFANPYRDGDVLLTAGTSNVVITNNVFYQPRGGGVSIGSCSGISSVAIDHNLSDREEIVAGQSCGFAISDNQLASDPLFLDLSALDFRLQLGSPAIDRGTGGPLVPDRDHAGVLRPQGAGYDVGAFEYTTGESAPDAGVGTAGDDAGGPDGTPDGTIDEPGGGGCAVASGSGSSSIVLVLLVWRGRARRSRARLRRARRALLRAALLVAVTCSLLAGCASPSGDAGDAGGSDAVDLVDASSAPDASTAPRLVPAVDISVWTRTLTDPDVDCLWELGYRHVIAGTQNLEVLRQQLPIALRGGLTVDLYVFLEWGVSIDAQVGAAVELTKEFPQIGRIWLDVEEDPAGRGPAALHGLIDASIAALGNVPGGIYTGKGWWQSYLEDTHDYADQPLWYARYDEVANLDAWDEPASTHRFGGWQAPVGKQYGDYHKHTCDLAVDRNILWVNAVPEVTVDRSIPDDDGTPPPAPTGLRPDGGLVITTTYVRPTAPAIREASTYELALESWNGSAFVPYWSTTRSVSDLTLYPALPNRDYRWRIRAGNSHGFGPWSDWAVFTFRG